MPHLLWQRLTGHSVLVSKSVPFSVSAKYVKHLTRDLISQEEKYTKNWGWRVKEKDF